MFDAGEGSISMRTVVSARFRLLFPLFRVVSTYVATRFSSCRLWSAISGAGTTVLMAAFLRFRLGFVIGGVGSGTQEGARMVSEGTRRKARGRLHVAIPTLARLGNSRLKARAHNVIQ